MNLAELLFSYAIASVIESEYIDEEQFQARCLETAHKCFIAAEAFFLVSEDYGETLEENDCEGEDAARE